MFHLFIILYSIRFLRPVFLEEVSIGFIAMRPFSPLLTHNEVVLAHVQGGALWDSWKT